MKLKTARWFSNFPRKEPARQAAGKSLRIILSEQMGVIQNYDSRLIHDTQTSLSLIIRTQERLNKELAKIKEENKSRKRKSSDRINIDTSEAKRVAQFGILGPPIDTRKTPRYSSEEKRDFKAAYKEERGSGSLNLSTQSSLEECSSSLPSPSLK